MSWPAVALAIASAFLFAVAAAAQQREAAATDGKGVGLILALARNPRWWAGLAGDTGGYVLQASAIAVGSLLVVQPLLVLSLLFALPLAARWNQRPIARRELWWALALCIALAVFMIAGNPDGGVDVAAFRRWTAPLVLCGVLLVGGGTAMLVGQGRARIVGMSVAAGVLFGLSSALTKSVMNHLGAGPEVLLTSWETYLLLACGGVGFTLQQMAYQAGSLEISLPAITVLDPIVSSMLGIWALSERVQADGAEWVLIAVSVAVMVAGTAALARAGAPTPPTGTAGGTAPPSPRPAAARTPPGSPS
jgi:drug/metabolite transporter (DMT)-like permease